MPNTFQPSWGSRCSSSEQSSIYLLACSTTVKVPLQPAMSVQKETFFFPFFCHRDMRKCLLFVLGFGFFFSIFWLFVQQTLRISPLTQGCKCASPSCMKTSRKRRGLKQKHKLMSSSSYIRLNKKTCTKKEIWFGDAGFHTADAQELAEEVHGPGTPAAC